MDMHGDMSAWICTALVVIESMIINQNADNAWVLLIPGLITLTNFVGFGGDKDDMEQEIGRKTQREWMVTG